MNRSSFTYYSFQSAVWKIHQRGSNVNQSPSKLFKQSNDWCTSSDPAFENRKYWELIQTYSRVSVNILNRLNHTNVPLHFPNFMAEFSPRKPELNSSRWTEFWLLQILQATSIIAILKQLWIPLTVANIGMLCFLINLGPYRLQAIQVFGIEEN